MLKKGDNLRLEDLLLENCNGRNQSFFAIDDSGEWDCKTLRDKCLALSNVLLEKKVKPLDFVGIISENSVSFVVSMMAILHVGAIAAPLDPQLPIMQVKEILLNCNVKCVCISGIRPEKNFRMHSNEANSFSGITFLNESNGDWQTDINTMQTKNGEGFTDSEHALLLFTSGTTGHSKGALLTHKAIMKNVDAIIDYMNPSKEDIFLVTKTLVHASTLTGELLVALKAGAKIIMENPVISPSAMLARIQKRRPTIIGVNPSILQLLIRASFTNHDVSSVKRIYTSGAVATEDILFQAENLFHNALILNVYGLTEAGPRVAAQRAESKNRKYGSVGSPIKGVRILVKSNQGTICKPYEKGTIFVETESIMTGYWNNPEDTYKKISNGWINTGDIGYFDEDGNLFISGRADEVIIRGAHNIDLCKIENIIKKYTGILDCVVFGVPEQVNGNRIICFYKKENNAFINKKDLITNSGNYLAQYEIPQEIYEVDEIPSTVTGKISRNRSIEFYNNQMINSIRKTDIKCFEDKK